MRLKIYLMLILFLVLGIHAQPTTITYQGKLLDNANMPVNQTSVPFTFAIYDASTGGTKLWPTGVSVSKNIDIVYGLYTVALGTGVGGDEVFTASMFTGTTPYLEVVVDGTTLPRTPLTNVPFSLISNQLSASGWASPGSIGSTTPGTATFTGLTVGTGATNYVMPGVRGSNNQVLQTDGSGNVSWETISSGPTGAAGGDLSGTYPNPSVANDAITSAKISDGTIINADVSPTAAIAYSKLSLTNSIQNADIVANAITTSKVANGTVTTSKLADSAVSGLKLLTNAVQTAHINDGAVTDYKVANGISYSKLTGAPTSLPPSGAAGGDLTGTYPNPIIANSGVTSAKILDGTIVNADISPSAAIAYSKLNLDYSIVNADIVANAITTSKVANGTVTTSKLADSAVSGLKLLTYAVQTAHINDGAVTTNKLADNSVNGNKIAMGSDASGDIMYYDGTNYVRLPKGADGEVLTLASGIPDWASASGGSGTAADAYGDGSAGALTISSVTDWGSSPPTNYNFQFTNLTINENLTVPSGTIIRCTGSLTIASGKSITVTNAVPYDDGGTIDGSPHGGRTANNSSIRFGGMGPSSNLDALRALTNNKGGASGGSVGLNGSESYYGSRGGGRITILCNGNITLTGNIYANGENVTNPSAPDAANTVGAGGGAGGVVVLSSQGTITISGTIQANGANGADGENLSGSGEGGGGGGGGGLVFVMAPAANSVTTTNVTVNGGNGGTSNSSSTSDSPGSGGGACGGNGGDGGARAANTGTTPPDYTITSSAGSVGKIIKIQVAKPYNLIKY